MYSLNIVIVCARWNVTRVGEDRYAECDNDISELDLDALYGSGSQQAASKKPRVEFFDSHSSLFFDSIDTLTTASSQSQATQSQPLSDHSQPGVTSDWDAITNIYGNSCSHDDEEVEVINESSLPADRADGIERDSNEVLVMPKQDGDDGTENVVTSQLQPSVQYDEEAGLMSPSTSKRFSRNKFAVNSAKTKPQFSLNISPKGEVKSRLFGQVLFLIAILFFYLLFLRK